MSSVMNREQRRQIEAWIDNVPPGKCPIERDTSSSQSRSMTSGEYTDAVSSTYSVPGYNITPDAVSAEQRRQSAATDLPSNTGRRSVDRAYLPPLTPATTRSTEELNGSQADTDRGTRGMTTSKVVGTRSRAVLPTTKADIAGIGAPPCRKETMGSGAVRGGRIRQGTGAAQRARKTAKPVARPPAAARRGGTTNQKTRSSSTSLASDRKVSKDDLESEDFVEAEITRQMELHRQLLNLEASIKQSSIAQPPLETSARVSKQPTPPLSPRDDR